MNTSGRPWASVIGPGIVTFWAVTSAARPVFESRLLITVVRALRSIAGVGVVVTGGDELVVVVVTVGFGVVGVVVEVVFGVVIGDVRVCGTTVEAVDFGWVAIVEAGEDLLVVVLMDADALR